MLGCNVSKDQRADSDGGDILNDGFVGEYVIRHVFFRFLLIPRCFIRSPTSYN